jgi:ABC-type branched-subunit amino acid transport system substrate-binding protein
LHNKVSSSLLAVIAILMIVTVVAGCAAAPAAKPPVKAVKPEAVWFRATIPLTGPYAASMLPSVDATKEAMDYVNTKYGGIDGVPWKYELLDDGMDVAKSIANYEKFKVQQPKTLVTSVWNSAIAEALKQRFNEDGIICVSCAPSAAALYPVGNTVTIIVSYTDGFGLFCDWLAETQPKPIKLAFLTWDSSMGKAILTDECKNYAKSKGVEIVASELFGMRDMDVSTQLTKIKDAGADWVYTNTLGPGPVVILKSMNALGLIGKMKLAGDHFAMDNDVNVAAGPLAEGLVGYHNMVTWYETDNPYVKSRIDAFTAAKRTDQVKSQPHLVFQAWFEWMRGIYEAAVKDVGWEKIDAAALKKQFFAVKDQKTNMNTMTLTADKPEPRHARIVQVKGGKILPITDWRVCPDLRPASAK